MTAPVEAAPVSQGARNTYGRCADCSPHYHDHQCRNPDSPYGGKVRLPQMGCWAAKTTHLQVSHD